MERFYDMVIHPKNDKCPRNWGDEEPDCDNCEFRNYIGTFGGEYYVDCEYNDR